jgi:sugar phosphate isomerase/epimerase
MRLGGPVYGDCSTPEAWVQAVRSRGYSAAFCPVGPDAPDDVVEAYERAAAKAGIVMAEVGAWSNPISPDPEIRAKALALCKERLALAERIGARCCVNIAGSLGDKWDGPHPLNLSDEAFELTVETVREIIDAVQPTRTFYTLETMPWVFPDSADSYLRLIEAIDRPQFAVHLDPVNLVSSPQRYYHTGALIRDCFEKLGPYIKSCHAKDIKLADRLTVHLDECRIGLGAMDYRAYLTELARLDPDTPLMLEHLPSAEEYALAAAHVRSVAAELGLQFIELSDQS